MRTFSTREFLNDPHSPSTGSVVAYDGPDPWKPEERFTFLEVGDCHVRARIHQTVLEGREQFIFKMKLLRTVVDEFITHLEEVKSPQPPFVKGGQSEAKGDLKDGGGNYETKGTAKCGLGVACYDPAIFLHGGGGDDGVPGCG